MASGVVLTAMLIAAAPVSGPPLVLSPITINNQPGEQYDPHVDGDLAAYSDAVATQIHYYRFATAADAVIPNTLADGTVTSDLLSAVNADRIAFTRQFPDRIAIMLFTPASNTLAELAPVPGSNRQYVGLGANTVAFGDIGLDLNGEIVTLDLTSNVTTRLTTDAVVDRFPAVSPDGNTIVWEHCPTLVNCDIWRAVRSGAAWAVSPVTAGAESEHNPDSNGSIVVYDSVRASSATGPDLYYTPVAGGPEVQLAIAGEEYNPSARGDYIAFEHRVTGQPSDIWLYQISTNRTFAVTTTPDFDENLNDLTVLADGSVRVVWQATAIVGVVGGDILGATFTVPPIDTCPGRSVVLEASRTYRPPRWVDAFESFSPTLNFVVPHELAVTSGSSGHGAVTLVIGGERALAFCLYRGGAPAHPQRYSFAFCFGGGGPVSAGTTVAAKSVLLHVDVGDWSAPSTAVRLPISETCGPASWPRPRHRCHHHGEHHDGDDDDRDHD